MDPTLCLPVVHYAHQSQRCGNGRALKVLALTACVLGKMCNRHIEPRQARQPAQHKHCQHRLVHRAIESQCERGRSRRDAKRHEVCKRVQLLAHQARLLAQAGNAAVHEIEKQPKWNQSQRADREVGLGALRNGVGYRRDD